MKRYMALAILVFVAVCEVGCGKSPFDPAGNDPDECEWPNWCKSES